MEKKKFVYTKVYTGGRHLPLFQGGLDAGEQTTASRDGESDHSRVFSAWRSLHLGVGIVEILRASKIRKFEYENVILVL